MSLSRRKAKKLLKKQSRVKKQPQASLPHAKRKGGRYVYPAGAYRSVMAQVPPVLTLPVAKPFIEPEIIAPLPKPQIPEALEAETAVQSAEEETRRSIPFRREYLIPLFALAMMFMAYLAPSQEKSPATLITNAIKETAQALKQNQTLKLSKADPLPELNANVRMDALREPLEEYLDDLDGDWAVYIRNLNNDEVLSINDHRMPSASLIKLITAGCYLEKVENGDLEESSRSETDLEYMISWSDNDAWEDLETLIGNGDYNKGLQAVTDFADDHGYENTGRLIGGDSIYSPDADNFTSVSETADVLYQIYQGTFVSQSASERLLALMLDQHVTTKIPAGLPEGIVCANKTGELSGVENDAAIVYGLNTDYILVIMSDDNYIGTAPVAELSEYIYGLLNPGSMETEE